MMNHVGVCHSYDATWQCLRHLTAEARFLEIIKQDHWIWIYDNLNFKKSIRHERSGMQVHISLLKHTFTSIYSIDIHPDMMNVTSRLAVKVKYLPEGNIDWSDTRPQRSRSELTIDDLIPNESDGEQLYKRAVDYVMSFLVNHFKSLQHLKNHAPVLQMPHPVSKSHVVPMKVLHKDEKYTKDTIDILECLKTDANMRGDHQVCTCMEKIFFN